jgi:hypothetical protein
MHQKLAAIGPTGQSITVTGKLEFGHSLAERVFQKTFSNETKEKFKIKSSSC